MDGVQGLQGGTGGHSPRRPAQTAAQKGDGPPISQALSLSERLTIGASLPAFLVQKAEWWAPGAGMHQSIVACYPPEAALERLDTLAEEVESRGHGDESLHALPLRDDLALGWAFHRAGSLGANATLNQRLAAVLDSRCVSTGRGLW